MALAVVQVTPQTRVVTSATAALTMSTPPVVGNALILPVLVYNTGGTLSTTSLTCADNKGNTYVRVVVQTNALIATVLFACQKIVTTGPPFTVTVTQTSASPLSYFEACILEVGSLGPSLLIDQTSTILGSSASPTPGATAALTNADVLVVSAFAIAVNQTSLTVESVTPAWTQVVENLSYSASIAGEADYRLLTGVGGTTQNCTWVASAPNVWAAVLAAFGTTVTPGNSGNLKGKQGNKHTRTDENGSVKVTPVTAGSATGPLTPFAHVACDTDATGALKMAVITLNPPLGPLTDLANLRVCTDENEALLVAINPAGSLLGPLTNLGNLRARTDARGSLVVVSPAPGSLTSAPSPALNLRGRTDENGALIVTGLV